MFLETNVSIKAGSLVLCTEPSLYWVALKGTILQNYMKRRDNPLFRLGFWQLQKLIGATEL